MDSAKSREGGSSGTARRPLFAPDVHQPVEERAGRDDERLAAETAPILELQDRRILPSSCKNPPGAADDPVNIRLGFERRADPFAVAWLVRLRPGRPHRRPARAVEQLELYSRSVDCAAHQSAERIDFTDQMSLRRAANRRIARHVRDGFSSERAQSDAAAQLRRRPRGLHARVAAADHDDI